MRMAANGNPNGNRGLECTMMRFREESISILFTSMKYADDHLMHHPLTERAAS